MLYTNLASINTNASRHWTFGYNNYSSARNFYVNFKFRGGDKGAIIMLLLGASTSYGAMKLYLPIASDINRSIINGSTIKQFGSGSGFNGEVIQKSSDGTYNLIIMNVVSYAMVEMVSSNCEIIGSYFA